MSADIQWGLFVVASVLLIVTPGQDMVLVMSRSLAHGARAGVATAAGVSVGLVGHTLLATAGLGALLRAFDGLFVVMKLVGAAYLIWLGIALLRAGATEFTAAGGGGHSAWRRFREGALSNIANPKIAVFYFAFLPQFVAVDAAHPTIAIFLLGVVFAALTFLVKAPVGLAAGRLASGLRARPAVLTGIARTSGVALILLGLQLALARR
ncbi:MAG: LysE family translocator [Burkholderiaceae bacterium]